MNSLRFLGEVVGQTLKRGHILQEVRKSRSLLTGFPVYYPPLAYLQTSAYSFSALNPYRQRVCYSTDQKDDDSQWADLGQRMVNWKEYGNSKIHNPWVEDSPGKRWQWKNGPNSTIIADFGDSVVFNSLLAYSEPHPDSPARRAIDNSQYHAPSVCDSDLLSCADRIFHDGRWLRSPIHFDKKTGKQTTHYKSNLEFSRDGAIGVLLHLVTHHDKRKARQQLFDWLTYIAKTSQSIYTFDVVKMLKNPLQFLEENVEVLRDFLPSCHVHPFNPFLSICSNNAAEHVGDIAQKLITFPLYRVSDEEEIATLLSPPLMDIINELCSKLELLNPILVSQSFLSMRLLMVNGHLEETMYESLIKISDSPHLEAISALTRIHLGRNAKESIKMLISKSPNNLFYQYLLYRYYPNDSEAWSLERLRDKLLEMSPKEVTRMPIDNNIPSSDDTRTPPEYKFINTDSRGYIHNGEGDENQGHQWAWERDVPANEMRNTMGWDCVFMGNLLQTKDAENQERYINEYLPDKIKLLRIQLLQQFNNLQTQYQNISKQCNDPEDGLSIFIERAYAIITKENYHRDSPEIYADKLEKLYKLLQKKYKQATSLDFDELRDITSAVKGILANVIDLKMKSQQKFKRANRLGDHGPFWQAHWEKQGMKPCEEIEENTKRANSLYLTNRYISSKVLRLLKPLILKMEAREIGAVISSYSESYKNLIKSIKETSDILEYHVFQNSLNSAVNHVNNRLQDHQQQFHLSESMMNSALLKHTLEYEFFLLSEKILPDCSDTNKQLIHDAVTSTVDQGLNQWQNFQQTFGLTGIVKQRVKNIEAKIGNIVERVQTFEKVTREALHYRWIIELEEAGYPVDENLTFKEDSLIPTSWQPTFPDCKSEADCYLVDAEIRCVEKAIDNLVSFIELKF